MAAPVAGKIILPNDSGNAGKNVRTQTRVVGSDTVHEHFMIQARQSQVLGVYRATLPLQAVVASAHNGTSTGIAWIHLPTAIVGKRARIRKCIIRSNASAATPTIPSLPRVGLQQFTFSGTASGAQIAAIKVDRANVTAGVLDIRTAVTGLTVAMVGTFGALLSQTIIPPFMLAGTAADILWANNQTEDLIDSPDTEDEWPVIIPGEGLVLVQADNGTTSDIRKYVVDILWDEIDVS